MDKNRKRWGYIFDEKLDMLIPNIPRQKKFVKMSIKPTDYCLLKKYFTKYNVMIDDLYEYF